MKILSKLIKKDLSLNKKRTIGTILGIFLSSALITVVGGMFFVLHNTLVEDMINQTGYWHLKVNNVNNEDIKKIGNSKDYSDKKIVNTVGSTILVNSYDDYYSYNIKGMDKDTFDFLKYDLKDGVYPQNENEILINNSYHILFNVNIGDTIKIPVGTLVDKNGNKIDSYIYDSKLNNSKEISYKVVGIINYYREFITFSQNNDKSDIYLTLNNPSKFESIRKDIKDKYGYSTSTNQDLLRWEIFSFSERTLSVLISLVSIALFITYSNNLEPIC